MRNSIVYFAICALSVLFLSTIDRSSSSGFIFSAVEDSPVLPAENFDYSVEFPEHIINSVPDDDPLGYETIAPNTDLADAVTDEGATLGRVLFYDKKLSALENISCASCHLSTQSFADNKALSQGVESLTTRNSMHLNDIGWTKNKGFFWDFRSDNLHQAVELPLKDANEIGADIFDLMFKLENTDYYPDLFADAYGDAEVTENRILDALSQFMSSINSFNSKFDEGAANGFENFSESEQRGLEIFAEACSSCHSEGNGISFFGDIFFEEDPSLEDFISLFPFGFTNGLQDVTDMGVGDWIPGMEHLFKSPTLRNVALTAPYMHDGRLETLDDVIDFYSNEASPDEWDIGLIPLGGFDFTDTQKADLKSFLLTLTDETMGANPKWADPFEGSNSTKGELLADIKIMPNPMHLYSEVHVDNSLGERFDVNIIDGTGRVVKTDYFTTDVYTITKGDFQQGMYYINITKGDEVATYKLAVQ